MVVMHVIGQVQTLQTVAAESPRFPRSAVEASDSKLRASVPNSEIQVGGLLLFKHPF
jgi:hypothetical protein